MTITVTPLQPQDHTAVLALSVAPDQDDLIASNADSLDEAAERPECVPLLIRAAGEPVGFAMYALDPDDGQYWIYRLMIDQRFQGRGHGGAALAAIVALLAGRLDCSRVIISYHPENVRAAALYRRFGFRETGEVFAGETVARYDIPGKG